MFKKLALLSCLITPLLSQAQQISSVSQSTADYAVKTYQQDMVQSLKQLIKYNTVAIEGTPSTKNPTHIAFKAELKKQALALGLDFEDHGYVAIVGLGESKERVGIITHGDVQPVNPTKWAKSPFELDLTSQPGKLIGRGTEDDKGPISTAMYAMKAIKDNNITLHKRLELYVYMAEESDWQPLKEFIKHNSLPQTNITIDASYPAVIAEKGWGMLKMTFPKNEIISNKPYLSAFTGGLFGSQIPEDAQVIIENANPFIVKHIQKIAAKHPKIKYTYQWQDKQLTITALGKSAHSSKPEDGLNAITHLAELLSFKHWPNSTSGALVNFINDNLGTGLYGEKFGEISYEDNFMGKMTVSPTVLKQLDDGIQLNINIRRPKGKMTGVLELEIRQVLAQWQAKNKVTLLNFESEIEEPFVQDNAPHLDTLLNVFSHYTGIENPQPISIGGGTNSRLFPNAVSFGPSMPNAEYTGHSEHEFITMKQFKLNLQMYTAVMIELAK